MLISDQLFLAITQYYFHEYVSYPMVNRYLRREHRILIICISCVNRDDAKLFYVGANMLSFGSHLVYTVDKTVKIALKRLYRNTEAFEKVCLLDIYSGISLRCLQSVYL